MEWEKPLEKAVENVCSKNMVNLKSHVEDKDEEIHGKTPCKW